MSQDQFLKLLQSILTMTDAKQKVSAVYAGRMLENLFELALDSGKCDGLTLHMMENSIRLLDVLIKRKADYAGVPGDYAGNQAKRNRLGEALYPRC